MTPIAPARTLTPELRRKISRNQILIVGAFVAVAWGLWALKYFFNIDFTKKTLEHKVPADASGPLSTWFWIATAVTAGGIPWCWWTTRKKLRFAEFGVEVFGTITSIKAGRHGQMPVRYSYEYDGRTYHGAVDLTADENHPLAPGVAVHLLVDPQKPSKSLPYDEVMPAGE
jgi:hypothetical protein